MAGSPVKKKDEKLERRILNLMLKSEKAIDTVIDQGVTRDDFDVDAHVWMFDAIMDIYSNGEYGGVAVEGYTEILKKHMLVEMDVASANEAIRSVKGQKDANPKHLGMYLSTLRSLTKIRRIWDATNSMVEYMNENAENLDADELSDFYEATYQEVYAEVMSTAASLTTHKVTENVLRDIIEEIETPSAIKFGLDGLDDYCKLLRGYLTYIAGDTGIGKTTVATYIAQTIASTGAKVLFVNLETNSEDCLKKLISSCVELNGHRIKYTHLINPLMLQDNPNDMAILEHIAQTDLLSKFGIYWIYKPDMTVEELHREVTRHVRMYDIDVVIGDYYQLLQIEGDEGEFDAVKIPKISKSLMTIAGQSYINPEGYRKKLVHIWLSQTNKEVSYRADRHPTKDDLWYGGSRDARLVLGIYRDEYYDPDNTEKPGIIELGILKQNNGIAGEWFDFVFDAQYQTIRNLTGDEKELLMQGDDEDEDDE